MGRLGTLHNLFSVCLANAAKSGTLVTPHQSSLSFLFVQQPIDPTHRSLLGKNTWAATKTLQEQTKSDQHIFSPSPHGHHQLSYWLSLASNTQTAPLHKENPSVNPFPKPRCPCTWSTSTPRALWLHMQNRHIREGGTLRHSWSSACTFLPTAVLPWRGCSKVWQDCYTHAQESFDFLQALSVLHLNPRHLTT